VLDGWSYFWGGIGGPIFIVFKGFAREALHMLAATVAIASVAFLLVSFAALVLVRPAGTGQASPIAGSRPTSSRPCAGRPAGC